MENMKLILVVVQLLGVISIETSLAAVVSDSVMNRQHMYDHWKRSSSSLPSVSMVRHSSDSIYNHHGSAHKRRPYDVPQIDCPRAGDGMERFACPSTDLYGRYRCIEDHMLCDGYIECPGGEDENGQHCMFYKMTKSHMNVLADALLRWIRGR